MCPKLLLNISFLRRVYTSRLCMHFPHCVVFCKSLRWFIYVYGKKLYYFEMKRSAENACVNGMGQLGFNPTFFSFFSEQVLYGWDHGRSGIIRRHPGADASTFLHWSRSNVSLIRKMEPHTVRKWSICLYDKTQAALNIREGGTVVIFISHKKSKIRE